MRVGLAALAANLWAPCPGVAQAAPEVSVRAVYETRIETGHGRFEVQRWSFTRRNEQLEYHFFQRDVTERWSQEGRARASCVRLFHPERTAVRYTHGDLLAFGVQPDWLRLNHVVAPPEADGFTPSKRATLLGREAQRYQRSFGPKRVEVAWFEDLAIPAEVRITAAGHSIAYVRLVELSTEVPDSIELRRFRQIDVADFGDMERDPFVARHHRDPLPSAIPMLTASEPARSGDTPAHAAHGPRRP